MYNLNCADDTSGTKKYTCDEIYLQLEEVYNALYAVVENADRFELEDDYIKAVESNTMYVQRSLDSELSEDVELEEDQTEIPINSLSCTLYNKALEIIQDHCKGILKNGILCLTSQRRISIVNSMISNLESTIPTSF